MKKLLLPLLLWLIIISTAFGQTERNNYKKIDYIKVEQEQLGEFMKLIEDQLINSYNTLLENSNLRTWTLYKVQYPGGTKSGYNYVSIATAENLSAFESNFSGMRTPGFIPVKMSTQGKQNIDQLCRLVKSELWKIENVIPRADTIRGPSRYMTMDYMKVAPGKDFDYLMLEDELAKPIHQERVNQNRMRKWEVYSLISPGGIGYGYNFATGNYFSKLEHIEFGFTNELIKQAMGENSDIPELFNTIYQTRDLVKVELWELAAHAK